MHINTQSPALANLDSYTKPRPFPEDTPQEKNIQQNQVAYDKPSNLGSTKLGDPQRAPDRPFVNNMTKPNISPAG
jgi:hypothetical protein